MATGVSSSPPSAARRERSAVDGRWDHDSLATRLSGELPLLLAYMRKEYRVRYRQSMLGLSWSIIQPLANLAIFGGILAGVLHVSSDGLPYISFAYAGLVPWTYLSSVAVMSVSSMLVAASVTGKVYFPREVVPLAQVGAFTIDLGIGTAIMLVILPAQHITLTYHLIGLVPTYVVLILWASAMAIFVATLTVFLRDLRYAVPFAVQLVFIASPIMYSETLFPHKLHWVASINPVIVVVNATRACALLHRWPAWSVLLPSGAAAAILCVAAIAYVRSVEPRLVDVT